MNGRMNGKLTLLKTCICLSSLLQDLKQEANGMEVEHEACNDGGLEIIGVLGFIGNNLLYLIITQNLLRNLHNLGKIIKLTNLILVHLEAILYVSTQIKFIMTGSNI